jgi:uncharacterized metal-binding protein
MSKSPVDRVGLVVLMLLMLMSLVVTARVICGCVAFVLDIWVHKLSWNPEKVAVVSRRVNWVGVAVGAVLVIWVHKRSWDPGKKAEVSRNPKGLLG